MRGLGSQITARTREPQLAPHQAQDGRSKVNIATLPDHHGSHPNGRQSGNVPFSGPSTERIETPMAILGTKDDCYIEPSSAKDAGTLPWQPLGMTLPPRVVNGGFDLYPGMQVASWTPETRRSRRGWLLKHKQDAQ